MSAEHEPEYMSTMYYLQQQQLFDSHLWLHGWADTRRNIHPLTLNMIINYPLSAFFIYYNP